MNSSKTYYYWLDPIRALAALLVLFVHARSVMFDYYINLEETSHNLFTQIFYFICSQGHISVATFFILSGFLVGGRNIEKLAKQTITARSFILNRLFRIGVPLTGAITLIIIIDMLIGNPISIISILGQYIGLQFLVGDLGGVFWTLTYEIWFYILLSSIIIIFSKNKNVPIGVLILVICCCILIQLDICWFCIISAGMIAYRLKDVKLPKYTIIVTSVLFPVFFFLYFFSTPTTNIEIFKTINPSYNSFIWIICCWLLAIIISQLVHCKPTSKFYILLDKSGRKLATFSYSLFLTHYQILKIYKLFFDKFSYVDLYSVMAFIGVCTICIAFAWLFYFLIERNTTPIQMWFTGRLNNNKNA